MTRKRHIPGESGLWILIVGDLIVFTAFFATFMVYRADALALFAASADTLDRTLGLTNTILLLSSSLCAALAVERFRENRKVIASRLLVGSAALGWLFVGLKIVEYRAKLAAGLDPTTDIFFTLYFALTGVHLLHVLIGEAILAVMIIKIRLGKSGSIGFVEGGACFWHMVDLLWVILFALFYLVN